MNVSKLLSAIVVLVAVISAPVNATSFTYSLDKSLGTIQYNESRFYTVDLGRRFSSIDSVTMHIAGYIHSGSPTAGASVAQALNACHGMFDVKGVALGSSLIIDGTFDETYTFISQTPYYTEWRQYMCANDLNASLMFNCAYSSGYARMTKCTVIVNGTPVPEPSSILALLCGISGVGGIIWRKKAA